MKIINYILIFIAAIVTLIIGLDSLSRPYPFSALGFTAWAISPYVYLTALNKWIRRKIPMNLIFVIILSVSVFGIGLIVDAMYIHLDAQGGLVYIAAPMWQWVFLVLASLPIYLLNRETKIE